MDCPDGVDQAFGPRVSPACRPFDFTLLFEDIILSCVPVGILICIIPPYLFGLLQRPCVNKPYNTTLGCKMVGRLPAC